MPVLGHAIAGLATGMLTKPASHTSSPPEHLPFRSAMWIPTVIGLAYLPDITAQLILLVTGNDERMMTHSVLFAFAAAAAIIPLLTKLGSVSIRHAFTITLISILAHDGLDLLQATDRAPWWPLSNRQVGT